MPSWQVVLAPKGWPRHSSTTFCGLLEVDCEVDCMKCQLCHRPFPSVYWFVDDKSFAGLRVCKECFAQRKHIADFDSRIQALQQGRAALLFSWLPDDPTPVRRRRVAAAVRIVLPVVTVLLPVVIVYLTFVAAFFYVLFSGVGHVMGHTGGDWEARARHGSITVLAMGAVVATAAGRFFEKRTFRSSRRAMPRWWTPARSRAVTVILALGPFVLTFRACKYAIGLY